MENKPPPRNRKLRIAWSVACGMLCLLLIVLWVRSYSARDSIRGVIGNTELHISITALKGNVAFAFDRWVGTPHPWMFQSTSEPHNLLAVFPAVVGKPPLSWLGFRWHFNPRLVVLVVPQWFLMSLAFFAALLPWVCWRFSLRTMLIATTLAAIILGIVAVSN
jgi:hypothetical protein